VRETLARSACQSVIIRRQIGKFTNSRHSVLALGRFPIYFLNPRESEDSHENDSHGMRDGDATPLPGGGAAGVPLRTLHR
jgi:hypothetical protein